MTQQKHIHIIGICGTFMGSIAVLATQMGFKVTGSDAKVYPPMSDQLQSIGIKLMDGFSAANLQPTPDTVLIGNALSRGNIEVETVLNQRLNYLSGAQWVAENVLKNKWVMAVSGTHGKTTTAAMLAWILDYAGIKAGFLIGGVVQNFGISARLGKMDFFVIEADEYDTAFFDKRSKFIHYHPQSLLINNLEFDHADIFDDLSEIKKQFHYLVRTVPNNGLIIYPKNNTDIKDTLGGWTKTETINGNWNYQLINDDGSRFMVIFDNIQQGELAWDLIGLHNIANALGAIALARHAGVPIKHAIDALKKFITPKRRLELRGEINQIKVYDDFAHHPSAIATTIAGIRAKIGKKQRIVAILELRSNTMKSGVHKNKLAQALKEANLVFIYQEKTASWSIKQSMNEAQNSVIIVSDIDNLLAQILKIIQAKDTVLIMSNGGFGNIHNRLLELLKIKYSNI